MSMFWRVSATVGITLGLTGPALENSNPIGPGDFIYVPPNAVHQPINDSLSDPMELIVARNTPVEIVVEYDPSSAGD